MSMLNFEHKIYNSLKIVPHFIVRVSYGIFVIYYSNSESTKRKKNETYT